MIALKQVLVPTDFSEAAHAALTYGMELARAYGATLRVLHAITEPRHEAWLAYAPGSEYMKIVEQLRADALKQMLQDVGPERTNTLPVVLDAVNGDAAEEILRYAADHAVGLIVCGTHGRRGWDRLVMGSVAEVIVRKAPCPVLSVQHPEREFVFTESVAAPGAQVSA